MTRTESSDHERRTAFGHEIPAANGHIADIDDGGLKGSLQQLGEPVTIGWSRAWRLQLTQRLSINERIEILRLQKDRALGVRDLPPDGTIMVGCPIGTPATFDGRAEDLESEPGSIVDDGPGGDPS